MSKYFHIGIFLFLLVAPGTRLGADAVRILVPRSTASLPLLQLAADDPLPGIDIQAETFINHPQALALLLKGRIDFIFTGTSQGWNNYLDGGPLVMINTGVWGLSYLIGKDPSIKTPADLKGRKLALPFPGAPLDFQTRYILQKTGIDPEKDLTISYSPFPQTMPKLLTGRIDTAALPEPLATSMVQEHGLLRQIDYQQAWAAVSGGDPRSPQVSLFSTRAYATRHAELIAGLLAAWQAATSRMHDPTIELAQNFAEELDVPAAVIGPAIAHTLFWLPSLEDNRQRVTAYYALVNAQALPGTRQRLGEDFFFIQK